MSRTYTNKPNQGRTNLHRGVGNSSNEHDHRLRHGHNARGNSSRSLGPDSGDVESVDELSGPERRRDMNQVTPKERKYVLALILSDG